MRNNSLKKGLSLFCLPFIFVVSCTGAMPDKAQRIDEFVRLCHEYRIIDGTVLVSEDGRIIYNKSYGLASREWNVPNELDSKYIIGSISKQFTAMLMLQLAQEDKLNLNGKISEYLPDFPKDKGDLITIHHLLCHSSGIPNNMDHFENWYTEMWFREYSTQELIELFYDTELEFSPGTSFAYSNTGYYICAAIIEKVTGKLYEDVLKERILQPLEMKNSGLMDSYNIVPRMTTGYTYWNFAYSKPPQANPSSSRGAGSIYSTAEDLLKWDRALAEYALVSKNFQDLMFLPQINLRGGRDYGYGVVLGEEPITGLNISISFAEHTGNQPGFSCLLFRIPDEEHSIIVLSNIDHMDLRIMKQGLLNLLYDQKAGLEKPISLVLAECATLEEIQAAIGNFRTSNSEYSIRRDAVNGLGFRFLRNKKKDIGLAVLEFNAEEHPRSSWVYESLAEACLLSGDNLKAIKNLEKVLELDPENGRIKEKLTGLKKK